MRKIVNLSGSRLEEMERALLFTKQRDWPPSTTIYSKQYRFDKVAGLKAGYSELLEKYELMLSDMDDETLVIVPNIGNSEAAARDMLGEDVTIVNIADISAKKRQSSNSGGKVRVPFSLVAKSARYYQSRIHP